MATTKQRKPPKTFREKLAHAARDLKREKWYMLAAFIMATALGAFSAASAYIATTQDGPLYQIIIYSVTGTVMFFGMPIFFFSCSRSEE